MLLTRKICFYVKVIFWLFWRKKCGITVNLIRIPQHAVVQCGNGSVVFFEKCKLIQIISVLRVELVNSEIGFEENSKIRCCCKTNCVENWIFKISSIAYFHSIRSCRQIAICKIGFLKSLKTFLINVQLLLYPICKAIFCAYSIYFRTKC